MGDEKKITLILPHENGNYESVNIKNGYWFKTELNPRKAGKGNNLFFNSSGISMIKLMQLYILIHDPGGHA